ncbi:MAG TPA: alanine--tRNA ligase [Oligoflexia bacterium]|nr:alanine--tRNA ligase [Oligoflexia bacterium]HMP26992.1 alanine--tRNA ligase [Oligoflexia bacterium]
MKTEEIRKKYIEFFKNKGHQEIPSASLIPQNDPTTLFTSSGMQPLVPYLLGEPHPEGRRLVNSQRAFRSQDIEEVGDNRHTTFFEMLGNWSLGDYFKKEQLAWIFKFLINELGFDPNKIYVTVFEGDADAPKDTESIKIWKELFAAVGINAKEGEKIFAYNARKNWWSRAGEPEKMPVGEPGGPDSEIFYEFVNVPHNPAFAEKCHPNCDCGRFLEIGNSVFMEYKKSSNGKLEFLPQKNVDFGGGLERISAALADENDIYKIDLFHPLIVKIEKASGVVYGSGEASTKAIRIIADHSRAAAMLMADGAMPSNKAQGYVTRRLARRAIRFAKQIKASEGLITELVKTVLQIYQNAYPLPQQQTEKVIEAISSEEKKFNAMIGKGLKEIEKIDQIDGAIAFKLFETFGFPWEMTEEIARERGQKVDKEQFEAEFKKHQERSRTASQGMFKGGLQDHSEEVVRLHTATHLLHQSLRLVLGNGAKQMGSNITAERLRFDFSHPTKLTESELKTIEDLVNEQIKKELAISFTVSTYKEAIAEGALAFFGERYPEKVKIYTIGDFSKEICGGPHVENTKLLGRFKIQKEESVGEGTRRIYAKLETV